MVCKPTAGNYCHFCPLGWSLPKPEGFDDKKKIHYENMVMSNDLDTEKELIQSPRVYAPMAPSRFTRQTRNGYY